MCRLALVVVVLVLPLTVGSTGVSDARAAAPPANDDVNAAQALGPAGGTLILDSTGATKQVGEAHHAGDAGGASVWFSWTPSISGDASIDTDGSGFDTLLAAYTGAAGSALTLVGSNDDVGAAAAHARTCFGMQAGVTYLIAVDGYFGASGPLTLHWGEKTDDAPCPSEPPRINNAGATPTVGMDIGSSNGTWVDYSFQPAPIQWARCAGISCNPIPGATNARYVLTPRDVGTTLIVQYGDPSAFGTPYNTSAPTPVIRQAATTRPNGRITWSTTRTSNPVRINLRSIFADGSSEVMIEEPAAYDSTAPAVSPDGTLLAYESGGKISLGFADGSSAIRTFDGIRPSWSPDGSRIAYLKDYSPPYEELAVMTLDGDSIRSTRLALFPDWQLVDVAWSPKGDVIAITYRDTAVSVRWKVALVSADGRGTVTTLTLPDASEHAPAWSPTGDKLLFVRGEQRGSVAGNADLWVMNADGSGQTLLIDAPLDQVIWSAAWSPDGTRIVYSQWLGADNVDLFSVPATGGIPTRLTTNPFFDSWPTWSGRATYSLLVEAVGTGAGTVTSMPAGISCTDSCLADFQDPTSVSLTAVPAAGSTFAGWSGACTGTGACVVPMVGYRDVLAEFNRPPPSSPPSGGTGGGGAVDLKLLGAVEPAPAVGGSLTWRLQLVDKTGGLALGTYVDVVLPAGVSLTSSTVDRGPGCVTTSPQHLRCSLDFLSAQALVGNITLATTVTAAGQLTLTATGAYNGTDPTPADNQLTLTANTPVAVVSPAPVPPRTSASASKGVSKTGNARANVILGSAFADALRGQGGNDRINGRGGNDKLYGGPGNDILTGGTGLDVVDGGAGNDTINARDNVKDTIRCGTGKDTVVADRKDAIGPGCEKVTRR